MADRPPTSGISEGGRRFKRVRTDWIVRIRSTMVSDSTRLHLNDRIRNASLGGVFIETRYPFPIGSLVEFEFKVPEKDQLFEAKGLVRWANTGKEAGGPVGMGIEFIEIAPKAVNAISAHLDEKLSPVAQALAALTSSPDHQATLRYHARKTGRKVAVEKLAKQIQSDTERTRAVLGDFAAHGFVEMVGDKAEMVECPNAALAKAVADWLADHPE